MNSLVDLIKSMYPERNKISLHEPYFDKRDLAYLKSALDSTFVSSVGDYIDELEKKIGFYTDASAVATVNGTSALHAALHLSGVKHGDLVITQALTFVATCNAIKMLGADPILLDVSESGMGLSAKAIDDYLKTDGEMVNGQCIHRDSGRPIKAIVPMHTFGHPCDLDSILAVAKQWRIDVIEDAAESLGSFYKNKHTGTLGRFGTLSFNGNKIITTGGGGMILCQNQEDAKRAKHITTTAKVPHAYEFEHDELAFNYRMPNLNAALGCAQFERINDYLRIKRKISESYERNINTLDYTFIKEPEYGHSNYWLNGVICNDKKSRDRLINTCIESGIQARPIWKPMHRLPMFKKAIRGSLVYTDWLENRVVNLPSYPTGWVSV